MQLLHDDLEYINGALAGAKVVAKGGEYFFNKFELSSERVPPVADGYVLHIRLMVCVWKWEQYQRQDGTKAWQRARYIFNPREVSFICDKTITETSDEVMK